MPPLIVELCIAVRHHHADISYKDQELETAFAKALGVPMLRILARAAGFNKKDDDEEMTKKLGPR